MKILILGANGFIGSHLCEAILTQTDWHVDAIDLRQNNISHLISHPHFDFTELDIVKEIKHINKKIKAADVILPLVAIANPALYVQDPLRIFELDFEANVKIIRECVTQKKRIIFPSTSEVYGMCQDTLFDEEISHLVTGPIHKERWIYASSKQLLDRIIYAYGKHHGLSYTLFRPFNWYGPRLDDVHNPKPGGSRVLTQFIGNILRGEPIQLVDGGAQKRSFTFINDGIDALMRIIANKNQCAEKKIFNIGNPNENISIKQLAETLIAVFATFPTYQEKAKNIQLNNIASTDYYGAGYQDVKLRVPNISRAHEALDWTPIVDIRTGVKKTIEYYLR